MCVCVFVYTHTHTQYVYSAAAVFEKGDFTHGMLRIQYTHRAHNTHTANSGNAYTRVLFGVKLLFDLIIC